MMRSTTLLIVVTIAGLPACGQPAQKQAIGSLASHVVAHPVEHRIIVEAAMASDEKIGKVVAIWAPVAPGSVAEGQIAEATDVQTRQRDGRTELLLIADVNDIDHRDVRSVYMQLPGDPKSSVIGVSLTTAGSLKLERQTSAHLPFNDTSFRLALLIGGEVQTLPPIQSTVSDQFIIDAGSHRRAQQLIKYLQTGS